MKIYLKNRNPERHSWNESAPDKKQSKAELERETAEREVTSMTRRFNGLAVCSPSPGRLDLFASAEDGVWHKVHNVFDGTWSSWKALGGGPQHHSSYSPGLAAISSVPDRIDLLFVNSYYHELLHRHFEGGEWSDWKSHGSIESNFKYFTAVATDPDHLSVLYNYGDRGETIRHWQLGGQRSSFPSPLWYSTSQLKAVSSARGRFDLFVRPGSPGTIAPNSILRRRFEGRWSDWEPVFGIPPVGLSPYYFESGIAATSSLDFFAVGRDKQLWHKKPEGQSWQALGGQHGEYLATVSWGQGRVDVFAIWNGVALMHRWFDGEWSNWKVIDIWPGPTQGYSVLRPQDLVALNVHGVGLRERVLDGRVELVPEQADAQLIVGFPPQHVSEVVLPNCPDTLPPTCGPMEPGPIEARLAGPSRLAFAVKENQSIPLSVSGVLNAIKRLTLLLTEPTNPPTIPDQNKTAIELPWRLVISPQEKTDCSHRELPGMSSEGVTELWHIRLSGSTSSGRLNVRPLVALEGNNLNTPLKSWLNGIVQIGSNPTRRPVAVDRLILSALGGWMSATGSWPEANMDWSHETAMGRDYYVRVLNRGALFPFGHHAVYVEVSERSFKRHPTDSQLAGAAALRKTNLLIITEPEREYGIGGRHEREFPFQHVTIEPRLVTPLEEPAWISVGSSKCFWPRWRGGGWVKFSVRARAGKVVVELMLPLLFVNKFPVGADDLNDTYSSGPSGTGLPTAFVGRSIPLAMKTVTEPLEGAIQEVHSMTFGAILFSTSDVGFYPKVTQLQVALPAVRQLLGQKDPMPARFSSAYVRAAPGVQPDELLDLINPKDLSFSSAAELTGALATPNFPMHQISRTLGPIAGNNLNPSQLFSEDAELLGVIKLRDVIESITKPPKVIWKEAVGATAPTAEFQWKEKLKKPPFGPFKPEDDSYIELKVVSTMVDAKTQLNTTGKLTNFTLNLLDVVELKFEELLFTACSGQNPSITFKLKQVELKGKLEFVKKLQKQMQTLGRGGPHIDVSSEEIKATYRVSLPTLALGPAFTLQNLALDTGLTLSLSNKPVVVDFAFGTQERPFLVTVSMFGGGGYLELGINADEGLQSFVGGIEFGASVAMDFVVARGEVHVLGGFVFAKHGRSVQITGYLRIGGSVEVLGLVRISVELTVSLTYNPDDNALIGAARLVVSVDLTFWSTSVELECHQRFDGSVLSIADDQCITTADDRRASSVEAALGPKGESHPWETYCRAFAGEFTVTGSKK